MPASRPAEEQIAIHEAGHAIVACRSSLLRLKLEGDVSIEGAHDAFGGADVEVDPASSDRFPPGRTPFEFAVVAAAGMASELIWRALRGERRTDKLLAKLQLGAQADLESVRDSFGGGVFYDFVQIATDRLEEGRAWRQVEALAAELLKSRTVPSSVVVALLNSAARP